MQHHTEIRLVPELQFCKQLGISQATRRRKSATGELPMPIKLGGKNFMEATAASEVIAQKRAAADERQATILRSVEKHGSGCCPEAT